MIISFDEKKHEYTKDKVEIVANVTKILGFVYGTGLENAPEYFVKRASTKGSIFHKEVDNYHETGELGKTNEFFVWKKWFDAAFKDKPFDSEKIIYATTPYGAFAGTVDFLCDGWLYDWKTSKTATKQQVKKWQMQLSFYTYALRQMGYAINEPAKILHITDTYKVINVDYLGDAFVEETMRLYQAGEKAQEKAEMAHELQTVSATDMQVLEDILFQIKALETVVNSYKEKIKEEMERRGILNLQIGKVKMTYVAGTIRQTFDSKAFKQDDPDLYAIYLKDTQVKPSVRITVD